MKKMLQYVKGKREEKRFSGSSDAVTVRNLSPEGGLDSDIRGYEVDSRDKTLSKLHKAAWSGNLEKLKGSMRKTDLDLADKQGRTPLHLAAVQGHSNILWFLISNRAKINVTDLEGKSPLVKAIECKQQESAQLLLERGADVNLADNFGNTALHLAASQGCHELCAALLRKGAKLEVPNRSGESALHLATRGGHKEMAEFLLRYGCDVNLSDCDERTPLMIAGKMGNQALVNLFLDYGADTTLIDTNGWSAEDHAVLSGHSALATNLAPNVEETPLPKFRERSVDVPEVPALPARHIPTAEEEKPSDTEMDSPRSLPDMPPPLKPPRSWELIQAGLTMPKGSVIPRQRQRFPRPHSWEQRSNSLVTSPWDSPSKSPLPMQPTSLTFHSLNRQPRNSKKPRPTSLPVTLPESLHFPDPARSIARAEKINVISKHEEEENQDRDVASRDSLSSDWDSEDESLPLDKLEIKDDKSPVSPHGERRGRFLLRRTASIDLADEESHGHIDKESATLGREGTMQGRDELWTGNATIIAQSPDSSTSSEDFFFQSTRNRVKHQNTIIQAQIEDPKKTSAIPEDFESDIEMGVSASVTKESINYESSPEVEKKILKITNSLTKESLNKQSSSDLEEKLLERSTEIIKQSFDLDSSPEVENKIIEIETNLDEAMNDENNKEKIVEKMEIDSSPDLIDNDDKDIQIPDLLLENLANIDSSPELENQKIIDISESIIPECSETEQSPEIEEKRVEIKKIEINTKSPQEKNVKDINENEKKELESIKKFIEIPRVSTDKFIIKEISISNENIDDEKENHPAPPPRKKKTRLVSRSPDINANKRSLGSKSRPRRHIKENWEGNAVVRRRGQIDVDLSDKDSVETHSDDTSLCYTKSPHAVLKRRLRAVTADRARLEHVLAGFEDQNRRIQYELADALHAARTQREISTQLAKQLAKAQKGELKALEEIQVLQLQLRTSNTELQYLQRMYEEGKSVSPLNERDDARVQWEHQHQLEQLRAEKSKVMTEKCKSEQMLTSEIAKLKDDVLKWMKLYESSCRNTSGVTNETIQEKQRLDALVTSLRTDLEMSLRKQNSLEKELATKQGKIGCKEAATNTSQSVGSDSLARELTAEKERSRRGVQQVRKLRAEVQSLRSRVLAAERRQTSNAAGGGAGNFLHSPTEAESVTSLRRQLDDLSRSVEEERSQRATLEQTICELRNDTPTAELERMRRTLEDEKKQRMSLEMRQGSSDCVTRAELDKVRRSYEVALARTKHEAELSAREELSQKLAQVNTFLEEQLQQQSRLEQLRCTSESQLRQDFQQTRHKLLSELAKVQATLKARNDEDRRLRKQMLSPRSEQAHIRFSDHLPESDMKPLRPAAAVLSLLVPSAPPQPPPPSASPGYHALRRELETSIRKAAEGAERNEPILSDPDDEQLAILKKKYFL